MGIFPDFQKSYHFSTNINLKFLPIVYSYELKYKSTKKTSKQHCERGRWKEHKSKEVEKACDLRFSVSNELTKKKPMLHLNETYLET